MQVKFNGLTQGAGPFKLPRGSHTYYLVISNCGYDNGTISGAVEVKSAHGFLPGNEISRKPFYGWMSLAYMVYTLAWAAVAVRFYKALLPVQTGILGLLLVCVLEAVSWWYSLYDINTRGEFGVVHCMAEVTTAMKYAMASCMLLAASQGWGLSPEETEVKAPKTLLFLYFIAFLVGTGRELVISNRHSLQLKSPLLVGGVAAGLLVNAIVYALSVRGLGKTLNKLEETHDPDKASALNRVRLTVILSVVLSVLLSVGHILDLTDSITIAWEIQFLLRDGAHQLLFMFSLATVMFFMMPSASSASYAKLGAETVATGGDVESGDDATWLEEEGKSDAKVAPEVIGKDEKPLE